MIAPSARVMKDRLHGGQPVLAPTDRWRESGVAHNRSAVYLKPPERNAPVCAQLLDEAAADDPRSWGSRLRFLRRSGGGAWRFRFHGIGGRMRPF